MGRTAIINTCNTGSTGKIAIGLYNYLKKNGRNPLFFYARGTQSDNPDFIKFESIMEVLVHYAYTRITGHLNGASWMATKRLVSLLKENEVTDVFLIILHSHYLNEKILLDYIINAGIRVVYIMADESPFLGNCEYRYGCNQYLNNCSDCPKLNRLQRWLCKNPSEKAFMLKQECYKKIDKIVFVGPEFVVKNATKSPLMNGKRLEIVDEAVDVLTYRPQETQPLRMALGIDDSKIVIVCVAPLSYERKGVVYFIETARRMEKFNQFVFVHVGYDKKEIKDLPSNFIAIGYVRDQDTLAQYYSMADLFVFPSLHDTMPNACLEALACGSPLLCFNTSGMPYMADETVMTLVESKNVDQMVGVINKTKKKTQSTIDTCRNYALKRFDNQKYFEKLVLVMNSIK